MGADALCVFTFTLAFSAEDTTKSKLNCAVSLPCLVQAHRFGHTEACRLATRQRPAVVVAVASQSRPHGGVSQGDLLNSFTTVHKKVFCCGPCRLSRRGFRPHGGVSGGGSLSRR